MAQTDQLRRNEAASREVKPHTLPPGKTHLTRNTRVPTEAALRAGISIRQGRVLPARPRIAASQLPGSEYIVIET